MSKDTVGQRVVSAINHLLKTGVVRRKGDIAEALQCSPQTITEILGERQGMKIDLLQKFFDRFGVSYEYIFEGKGEILKEPVEDAPACAHESPALYLVEGKTKSTNKHDFDSKVCESDIFLPRKGKTKSTNIIEVPVPIADHTNTVRIPVVDISVAAGSGYYNPDYLNEIDCIQLPCTMLKRDHTYLCVKIKGDSMVPTLQDGGYLIIRMLERWEWQDVKEGHVYVVAEKEGRAFVKRLKNRFKEHGFIVCMSDSPDVMRYPNFNLAEDEINTLWHAEWYISAKMPNIHNIYYSKVSEMEDAIHEIRFNLENQVRQLVRQELKVLRPQRDDQV